jgi:hypothetical protein
LEFVKQALNELPKQDVRWEPILRKIAASQSLATAHRFLRSLVFGAVRTGSSALPVSQIYHVSPAKSVQLKSTSVENKGSNNASKAVQLSEAQSVANSDRAAEALVVSTKGSPPMSTSSSMSVRPQTSVGSAQRVSNGLGAANFSSVARKNATSDVHGGSVAGHAAQKVLPDTLFEKLVGNYNSQVNGHNRDLRRVMSSGINPVQSMEPGSACTEIKTTRSSLVPPAVGVSNVESATLVHEPNTAWGADGMDKKRMQLINLLLFQQWSRADADEEVSRWQITAYGPNRDSLTYSYQHQVRKYLHVYASV